MENLNILTEQDAQSLEGEINEIEGQAAIQSMKLNKSRGSDRIPVEFYKVFWEDITSMLTDSINATYHRGEMSITQKRGILRLLYKKMIKPV